MTSPNIMVHHIMAKLVNGFQHLSKNWCTDFANYELVSCTRTLRSLVELLILDVDGP